MKDTNLDGYDLTLTILENEKSRIARELHDTTIQSMVHIIHQAELISHYMDEDPIKAKLELSLLSKNLKKAIADTRNIIHDIKPMAIKDLGLSDAMEEYFLYLNTFSDIHFSFQEEGGFDNLTEEERLIIFRILQEACNNAVKHSHGKNMIIKIKRCQNCFFNISMDDDGIGCEKENMHKVNHYGLDILKERVELMSGDCEIITEPGKGFHIKVIVPIA